MGLITIERKILEKNDVIAQENRTTFGDNGIFAINMVSSPGSGKTSIIEHTILNLSNKLHIAVIEGDIQTNLDSQRIDKLNIPVVQIVTKGGCHLDASLVRDAFSEFEDININLLIIENVGNLVCPAEYDLGESMKVLISSTTEGEDKPLKYPVIFRKSKVLLINKIDLLPHLNFSIDTFRKDALSINPNLKIFELSCSTGIGIIDWCKYLLQEIKD